MPGSSAGTLNAPSAFVTVVKDTPVALLVTTTVAPGMTPPPPSTTVPVKAVLVLPPWANRGPLPTSARQRTQTLPSTA